MKNKLLIATREAEDYRQAAFTLALVAALTACLPQMCRATSVEDSDFFIPDDLHFYNPLKHSDGSRKKSYKPSSVGLDNESLLEAASHVRDNDMNATQRALNHQWLRQQHFDGGEVKRGSRALSKILKMGFKTYWKSTHKGSGANNSDADFQGSVSKEMSYGVRVSGDKLKFSFEYEF